MSRESTQRRWAHLVTMPLVMKTGVRGVAGERRASSFPPLQAAGYIEDALLGRLIRTRRVTTEEMESCIRIAFV